jgi:hypothetical protein
LCGAAVQGLNKRENVLLKILFIQHKRFNDYVYTQPKDRKRHLQDGKK